MGGIVIDIWKKSKFFGSIGSQIGAKNKIFLLNPLPLLGLNECQQLNGLSKWKFLSSHQKL